MARRFATALLTLVACKAELAGAPADAGADDANMQLLADTMEADAESLGPWGTPQPVPGASDPTLVEDDCTLSSNALELYFKRNDSGDNNLYIMTRATTADPWSDPLALATLNTTTANEESPRLSSDDLALYFGSGGDIYKSTRGQFGDPWGAPAPVTALNTTAYEKWAAVCPGGYAVVSRAVTGDGQDLFEGTETGGADVPLDALNSTVAEQGSFITADCLHMYFQSNRDGDLDIFDTIRAAATDAWPAPTKLADFNATTTGEEDPWISADERIFAYASNAGGTKDVYLVTR
jgi:hypothetical protein